MHDRSLVPSLSRYLVDTLQALYLTCWPSEELSPCTKLLMRATNPWFLQISIHQMLSTTSPQRGDAHQSALHNARGQGHQGAESRQHPREGGWRCGTHVPSSHHKKTWSPSSSFKLASDAWWRETQHSHHELIRTCFCLALGLCVVFQARP